MKAQPTRMHVSTSQSRTVQYSTCYTQTIRYTHIQHTCTKKNEWWNDITYFSIFTLNSRCWFTSLWYWRSLHVKQWYMYVGLWCTEYIMCAVCACSDVCSCRVCPWWKQTNIRWTMYTTEFIGHDEKFSVFLDACWQAWHRGSIIFEIGSQSFRIRCLLHCTSYKHHDVFTDACSSHFLFIPPLSTILPDHKSKDGHPNPTDPPPTVKEWWQRVPPLLA